MTEAWRRTSDPTLEIMVSLLAPFAAYLPAEALGVSGVLAAVVAGLIAGRRAARALSPTARLMGRGVWDIVIFIDQRLRVHAHRAAAAGDPRQPGASRRAELIGWAVAISLTVIVARIVWVFPATYLPRRLSARIRARDPYPPPQRRLRRVVGGHARRGLAGGRPRAAARPFPERDLVIFLTFCVIVATLVGQGLTPAAGSSAGWASWRPTARTRRRRTPAWPRSTRR